MNPATCDPTAPQRKPESRLRRRLRRALRCGVGLSLLALGTSAGWLLTAPPPPAFAAFVAHSPSSEAWLLDRQGQPLQTLRLDYRARRLAWTPLQQMSPLLIEAVVQAEDRRFWRHHGVDLLALLGAVRDRLFGHSRRGASTLTMQLAAQLDPALRPRHGRRDVLQKLHQMRAAWALHRHWTRQQILEAYLNSVSFRGEALGVASAAQQLFAKNPAQLDAPESWILAALLPAPAAAAGRVAQRACRLSGVHGAACARQTQRTRDALARPATIDHGPQLAPHLARQLLHQPGERRRSTLDRAIQQLSLDAVHAQLRQLGGENVRDGAAIVVDNASGEVLAYVGSAGARSSAPQVDGARALRQAGSTLKPFLYALALERRLLTAASALDDSPLSLPAGAGQYVPQNYERDYKGVVSLRSALAGSLNIPAVRSLILVGVDAFRERLAQLGYRSGLTEPGDYYGYSLALGSAEVSLLEQVNAYRTLANGGVWSPLRLDADAATAASYPVIDAGAAWIVADILADRSARAISFDFDNPLATGYWSAVKTGTSKDLRDNWCIGFSPRYTVGVWVGNFEGDSMRTVSGITGAAPAWRQIMDALEREPRPSAPAPPPGLQQHEHEWYLAGTADSARSHTQLAPSPRIIAPADASQIALDPDIPLSRQQLILVARPSAPGLSWELDGQALGPASAPLGWLPLPGTHRLRLLDEHKQPLDQVEFAVRGLK